MAQQRVVIVGGGMVGISLALLLDQAQKNVPPNDKIAITLIEKQSFPPLPSTPAATSTQPILSSSSFDSRSTALSAGSVDILNELGVWSALSAQAEGIQRIHISDKGHYGNTEIHAKDYFTADSVSADTKPQSLGYVVENQYLGQCLLHQLHNSEVELITAATVTDCQMKRHGVALEWVSNNQTAEPELSNAQSSNTQSSNTQSSSAEPASAQLVNNTVFADLLCIADGADSTLRQRLGIHSQPTAYGQSAIIANVALAQPHHGIAYERFTEQGPLALLPLARHQGQHRAALVWTRHTPSAQALMQASDDDFLSELQACFGYRADRFLQIGQRHSYPLELVCAQEQIRSHVALVGNAAHFLHPVAGQGFNLSLRDCQAMVTVLVQAIQQQQSIGVYGTLKHYEALRDNDQQLTIGLTDRLVKLFSSNHIFPSVSRQLGLLGLQSMPGAKKVLARQMMGVG